jgi:DNA helicase-2/ATP-dependent DNA helicase PcrA
VLLASRNQHNLALLGYLHAVCLPLANFVVESIKNLLENGELNPEKTVAVIYRTNAQSRAVEEACVKHSLPYVIRGGAGTFYNRAEIKDCLCFLRWINNGRDQAAMTRAAKTPSKGIGEKAMAEFRGYCSQLDDFYLSEHPKLTRPTPLDILISLTHGEEPGEDVRLVEDAPAITDFVTKRALNRFIPFSKQMRFIHHKARFESVSSLIETIADTMKLKEHFDAISKSSAEFADRWSNIQELRQAAQRYSDDGPALAMKSTDGSGVATLDMTPLSNFLDDVALVADIEVDSDEERAEKLVKANLMTAHASKGMEFDVVFVIGNEEGTFPSQMAINEGENSVQLDEERRLCYVAMTRAKDHLVMTWRREVSVFAGQEFRSMSKKPSRFVNSLGSKRSNGSKSKSRGTGTQRRAAAPGKNTQHRSFPRTSSLAGVYGPPKKAKGSQMFRSTWDVGPQQPDRRTPIQLQRRGSHRAVPTNAPSRARRMQAKVIQNAPLPGRLYSNDNSSPHRLSYERTKSREQFLDSTWFYPVGSSVVHRVYGEGKVLEPRDKENVRVQFNNGQEISMPAMEAELFPN